MVNHLKEIRPQLFKDLVVNLEANINTLTRFHQHDTFGIEWAGKMYALSLAFQAVCSEQALDPDAYLEEAKERVNQEFPQYSGS